MKQVMDMFLTEFDEKDYIEGVREEGGANMIYLLVQDRTINAEIGAQKLGITVDELKHRMLKAGYNV